MTAEHPTPTRRAAPVIRAATPHDLHIIERLLTDAALPLDGVRDALADFVVADAGDELVGVAGLEVRGEHALLRSVAVADAWRSRGVGRALVDHLIATADARGLHALFLLTTTADRYFPSFGFRDVPRAAVPEGIAATAEFRTVCPASATVMCRDLRTPA